MSTFGSGIMSGSPLVPNTTSELTSSYSTYKTTTTKKKQINKIKENFITIFAI